jgi:hypothetical protein
MHHHGLARRVLSRCAGAPLRVVAVVCALWVRGTSGQGADLDLKAMFREGIPSSPFISVVYGYADAMLQHGRDSYGPQKSGLLLSALDRQTLAPLEARPPAPAGVPEESRPGPRGKPLFGANPQMDENLLRLLYFLKGLSGEDRYAQAADEQLRWFLRSAQSADTGLLPWGEHLSWDVMADQLACGLATRCAGAPPIHESARPWMLWDRCFALAPQQSRRFALGLWEQHVVDHETGALRCRARLDRAASGPATDCPRHAGFSIRTWAEAFAHTQDTTFLKAVGVVLGRYEHTRRGGVQPAGPNAGAFSPCDWLSLAIDCDGAARKVPEPLRTRLAAFAAREDEVFCRLPHDLEHRRGFAADFDLAAAEPDVLYTPLWEARRGRHTTAAVGMMCVSRYENTGRVGYRKLIVAAADAYLDSLPGDQIDAWPMTFGQAISLELAAFRVTARREYHVRAFRLGEIAVEKFFAGSPLPRASLKSNHYESSTGADTLALALAELHLATLHITAVRAPVGTIDR